MLIPRTLATTVDRIARQAVGKDWNLYAALLDHWSEIVGPDYALLTTPSKITFPKGKPADDEATQGRRAGGVLHVRLPRGLVMEFSFRTDQIRQRIATFFGYDAIARIAFEPTHEPTNIAPPAAPPPPLDPKKLSALRKDTAIVENDALREALENLGRAVLQKKSTP